MPTRDQVSEFLRQFKTAMNFAPTGLKLLNPEKNTQALLDLGLLPAQRRDIILSLNPDNYCSGPSPDDADPTKDVWIFGYQMDGEEIYIKLRLSPGKAKDSFSTPVVWSFHSAAFPMKYPLKGHAS
ncbi:MAG: hypothetical protein Q8N51_02265 [Gammaproteobacteria bacterium]|nr:hypothetical protein [Gammaproteobacteria bacterium]